MIQKELSVRVHDPVCLWLGVILGICTSVVLYLVLANTGILAPWLLIAMAVFAGVDCFILVGNWSSKKLSAEDRGLSLDGWSFSGPAGTPRIVRLGEYAWSSVHEVCVHVNGKDAMSGAIDKVIVTLPTPWGQKLGSGPEFEIEVLDSPGRMQEFLDLCTNKIPDSIKYLPSLPY
jgi:hypothetical protein